MEEERNYEPRYLPLQYWMQETSTWLIVIDLTECESAQRSTEVLSLVVASVLLDHGQQVHVSLGADNGSRVPQDQQPEQLPLAEQGPSDASGRQQTQPRRSRTSFRKREVKQLESVFEFTQYPDMFARRELAKGLNVPESRVKSWFKNRRAKYRKQQREAMLSDAPPAVQHQGDTQDLEQRSPVPLL